MAAINRGQRPAFVDSAPREDGRVSLWKNGHVWHYDKRGTHLNDGADAVPIADPMTAPRKRRTVRVLGLLMGLTQGHLKKLEERQGQVENSERRANSDNSFKRRHLAFSGR
jgi:hypothetical protein